MRRFAGIITKISVVAVALFLVCANTVSADVEDAKITENSEITNKTESEENTEETAGLEKSQTDANLEPSVEADTDAEPEDAFGTGSYKPVISQYLTEYDIGYKSTNGMNVKITCHSEMEEYDVMYSLNGSNYTLAQTFYSQGASEITEWLNLMDMMDPVTGNYRKVYLYVVARDTDGINPSVSGDVITIDDSKQNRDAANTYDRIVYLKYDQSGNYTAIDRLVIHVGEDIKLGVGVRKKSGEVIPLSQVPEIKAFLDNPNGNGYYNDPMLNTHWTLGSYTDGYIVFSYGATDPDDGIEQITYDNELKGDNSFYQYIEGKIPTTPSHSNNTEAAKSSTPYSKYYIYADSTWHYGDFITSKTVWGYLPVTVLPAEPGQTYFKVERGEDDTTIYSTRNEALAKMRQVHLDRKTMEDGGAVVITEADLFNQSERDEILYLINDHDRERSDMKPYEGDYLECSEGSRTSSQYSFTNECIPVTIAGIQCDKFIFRTSYITTKEEEAAVNEYVAGLFTTDNSLKAAKASSSNDTKAKAALDWTRSHVSDATGDRTRPIVHTAYNAFLGDHTGTCEAYALVYTRLCREMGVPVKIIMGVDAGAHTYTITKMDDGYYYYVDPSAGTWKVDYNSFSRAPEQDRFKRDRFVFNYMRKIKGYPNSDYNPSEPDFDGDVSISLGIYSEISINFYVNNYGDYNYAKFECGKDSTIVSLNSSAQSLDYSYVLPAKKLNSEVKLTLYKVSPVNNPSAVGVNLGSYSIARYYESAKRLTNDQKLLKFLEALMVYGDCGDNYFNNAGRTVDRTEIDKVTAQQTKDYARVINAENDNIKFIGTSLVLGGKPSIKYYYRLKDGVKSNTSIQMEASDYPGYNAVPDSYIHQVDDLYYVEIPYYGLEIVDVMYTVRFTDNTTGKSTSVTAGGFSYANDVLTKSSNNALKDLVKALYVVHYAADEYFSRYE